MPHVAGDLLASLEELPHHLKIIRDWVGRFGFILPDTRNVKELEKSREEDKFCEWKEPSEFQKSGC